MKKLSNYQLRSALVNTLSTTEVEKIIKGEEVWKPIPGYDLHEISSKGRVKRLARISRSVKEDGTYRYTRIKEKVNSGSASCLRNGSRYMRAYLLSNYNVENYINEYRTEYIHRIMVQVFFGKSTDHNTVTDHIDNNKSNNDIRNLRVVSHRFNIVKEIGGTGSSKFVGVCKAAGGKWASRISINGTQLHLGTFDTEQEASMEYQMRLMSLQIA